MPIMDAIPPSDKAMLEDNEIAPVFKERAGHYYNVETRDFQESELVYFNIENWHENVFGKRPLVPVLNALKAQRPKIQSS